MRHACIAALTRLQAALTHGDECQHERMIGR